MEDKPLDAAFGISPSPDSETDPEIQAVLDELVAAYGGLSDGEPLEMRTMRVDTPLEVADGPAPVAAGPQHGPRNRDESRDGPAEPAPPVPRPLAPLPRSLPAPINRTIPVLPYLHWRGQRAAAMASPKLTRNDEAAGQRTPPRPSAGPVETSTVPVVPPFPAGTPLGTLNDSLLGNILSYLSPSDVGASASACKKMHGLAEDPHIWRELFISNFAPRPADLPLLRAPNASPKAMFQARITSRQNRLEAYLRDKAARLRAQVMRVRQDALHIALSGYNVAFVIGSPMLLILLTTIFLANKLEGRVSWSYWSVLAPVWVLMSLCVIALLFGIAAWRRRDSPGSDSIWQNVWDPSDRTWSCQMFFLSECVGEARSARIHSVCMLCLLIAAPILICAKLEGSSMPWAVAFLPLWMLILGYLSMRAFAYEAWDTTDGRRVFVFSWLVLIPGIVSLALLTARLHGRNISLNSVFIPAWILACSIWLVMTISWAATSFASWRQGNRRDCLGYFMMYIFIELIAIPPLLFMIFIASNDSGATNIPPLALFSPLFVWMAMFLLITIILVFNASRYVCTRAATLRNARAENMV